MMQGKLDKNYPESLLDIALGVQCSRSIKEYTQMSQQGTGANLLAHGAYVKPC